MLKIKNLTIKTKKKIILKNINIKIKPGQIHVVMGPNGSGKSTLAKALIGFKDYKIISGHIKIKNEIINDVEIHKRAKLGFFLGFQNPISIPGVNNIHFLKYIYNNMHKKNKKDAYEFIKYVKKKLKIIQMKEKYLYRSVNVNFSGGEKKKNEILQMLIMNPKICILDEIDSGVDIDALKSIKNSIKYQNIKKKTSFILITHYNRLIKNMNIHSVHILSKGKIIKTGKENLINKIEKYGYKWL